MTDNQVSPVVARMTVAERARVVARFTQLNPGWDGAECADILDMLHQNDACLDVTEPFFETNPDLAHVPGAGVAAIALIWSEQHVDRQAMRRLLDRPGMMRLLGDPE